jgi:NAD dependent epimerase/dehydratase family enzyme
VLRRPSLLPTPAAALRLLLGEMAEVVLSSQRVVPRKALGLGYAFRFPELEPALRDLLR